jgi:hypothetical protein
MSNTEEAKLASQREFHKMFVKNAGKIIAPLYYFFAQRVKNHAEHPIKVSMRSGYPIKHALEHIGVASEELYINRDVAKYVRSAANAQRGTPIEDRKRLLLEYCKQQGLESPFTLVDNGYGGTISSWLRSVPWIADFQTLLLVKWGHTQEYNWGLAKDVTGMLEFEEYNHIANVYSREKLPASLHRIIEDIPKQHSHVKEQCFEANESGIVAPVLSSLGEEDIGVFKTFFEGMTEGLSICSESDKRLKKYLELMEGHSENTSMIQFPLGTYDSSNNCYEKLHKFSVKTVKKVENIFSS